jgi:hypothetical protein
MQGLKSTNEGNLKRIELLVGLITSSGENFEIEIGQKSAEVLKELIEKEQSHLGIYVLAKFIIQCKDNADYLTMLKNKVRSAKPFEVDLNFKSTENLVLVGY